MNDAHIDRRRNTRARKVHKVAPVARAIRAALAASATMLALSGTALAQDQCHATATHGAFCVGDLAPIRADASLSVLPVDLTRVVDDAMPASAVDQQAWATHAAIDAGSIATFGNGIVIGSYSGGLPYADVVQLDIVDVVSADETMVGADATAIGAFVNAGEGIGLLINGGDITASASSDTGTALAVGGFAYASVATAINDTTIVAHAFTDTGNAVAIGLQAYGNNAASYNYGDLTANATATGAGGTAGAYGLYTVGVLSAVSDNQGDIAVVASGDARAAAVGIYNTAGLYDAVVRNSGNVSAHAIAYGTRGLAAAAGLQATSMQGFGTVDVQTSGNVTAKAEAHGDYGVGVAYGVLAVNGPYGDVDVRNDGSINAVASAVSTGPNLVNAFGMYAWTYGGTVSIVNNGDIGASGTSFSTSYGTVYAMGMYVFGGGISGVATDVRNNGSLSVDATTYDGKALATGINQLGALATVTNGTDASIDVSADSQHSGVSGATGISNLGFDNSKVVNNGDINAYSHAAGSFYYSYAGSRALGIYAGSSPISNASVVNTGGISAVAVSEDATRSFGGSSGATGIWGYGRIVDIQNSGDLFASAHTNAGIAGSYGVIDHAKYSSNIVNSGDITAYAYAGTLADDPQGYAGRAVAFGTQSFGARVATETNTGAISATAIAADPFGMAKPAISYAYGVTMAASRTAALTTSGDITAYARADSGYANAYGVTMKGKKSSLVTNSGDVSAQAHADGGLAWAVGVYERALYNTTTGASTLVNSGDIDASAFADDGIAHAYGAVLIGRAGTYATNIGTLTSRAEGAAAVADGLLANTLAGTTYLQNHGTVGATAISTAGDARATGVTAIGTTVTTLITDGDIHADANATGGNAAAYGAYVKGGLSGIGLLINGGDIDATATVDGGLAYAVGAVVYADVATVINDDHVGAAAHAIDGDALAFGMQAYSFNAGAYNYGDIAAAAVSDNGNAGARGINAYGYFSAIADNAGDITVGVQSTADAIGTGVYALAVFSGAYATNSGKVAVAVEGEDATANGVLNADVYVGNATLTNEGNISVAAHGFSKAFAVGAYNFAYVYDATLVNNGDIAVSARAEGNADAVQRVDVIGAQSVNVYGQGWGDSSVVNDGSIAASGWVEYGTGTAWGAIAQAGPDATASIENRGTLYANMHADIGLAGAYGALVQTYGKAGVVNHGDIVALSSIRYGGGDLAFIQYADATGIKATGYMGGADVANDGGIHAEAVAGGGIVHAMGVAGNGNTTALTNTGGIDAIAQTTSWGGAFAYGANLHGTYDVSVTNNGTIDVHGIAHDDASGHYGASRATGIYAAAEVQGDISIVNNGDINAVSTATNGQGFFTAGAMAKGIDTYGKYDVVIENNANIHAIAASDAGIVTSYGVIADSKYYGHVVNAAGGVVSSVASTATLEGDYAGGRAFAVGVDMARSDIAVVENDGAIIAHAMLDPGTGPAGQPGLATAFGIHNDDASISAGVINHGDIEAVAIADGAYATAYGAFLKSAKASSTVNTGSILAAAQSNAGDAWAVGTYNFSYARYYNGCDADGCHYTPGGGDAALDNQGDIVAQAIAEGGVAQAYGAVAIGWLGAGITNAGHITSIAEGDAAGAVGAVANTSAGPTTVVNSGAIQVSATGTSTSDAKGIVSLGVSAVQLDNTGSIIAGAHGPAASATGASMESSNGSSTLHNSGAIAASATGTTTSDAIAARMASTAGVTIDNTGSIVADATGVTSSATALWLESSGANVITNGGTIAAFGDGERVAIASHLDASTSIANSGTIIGAITTGDLADDVANAADATWRAYGASSLGGGDDAIANAGTLVMRDATIDLGGYAAGNAFSNSGAMFTFGHDAIGMGGAFAARNDGTISFLDGAPDDVLSIDGDFAGHGTLLLDVSGWRNTSDMLYVTGDVAEGTTQVLDVDVIDLPRAPVVQLPLVYVQGESSAAQFVLGNVRTKQNDFTTLDVSLHSQIDTGNAARDLFYLGVDVTGLNDQGAIATALSPGVARLIDAQIGTFRQRMGVVPVQGSKAGLAPFIRIFSDSGDVNPDHAQNFGLGGDYGFSQSNHGWEVGLDTRPGDNVAFGMLVSKSDGKQRLDNGMGYTDLTGTGFGLYLTYLGNQGAYIDGSVRWTGVDATLHSATAFHKTDGSAETLNIEAGLNPWMVGGIGIQPQLQYTATHIADFQGLQGGSAEFVEQGGNSKRGRLGVLFSKDIETNGFLLQPYGSVNAVHEFDGEYAYSINDNALFGTTSLGGTSAMVELGLGARKDQWSLTGGFNWTDGAALDGLFGGQVIVRYSW